MTTGLERSVGCTIVSKNYFAYAKTLAESFLVCNPGHDFYILVVDRDTDRARFVHPGAQVIFLADLYPQDYLQHAFRFDILELNTNVKPGLLQHLLKQGYPAAYYFDPDIYCYRPVATLDEALSSNNILLTPHALLPTPDDGLRPVDRDFLKCGVYNLGFVGTRNTSEGRRFLSWWEHRCLTEGFSEPGLGVFVDQRWIDLVPCYFSGVNVYRNPGCNTAYWNLHERKLLYAEPAPLVESSGGTAELIFFHFSGFDPQAPGAISKHQNRFSLQQRPDLKALFEAYAERLLGNGYVNYKSEPYGFAIFTNGGRISPTLRRYYSQLPELAAEPDPFAAASVTHGFAKRNRLVANGPPSGLGRLNSLTVDERGDVRLRVFGRALRLLLLLLGPTRFELVSKLMRNYGIPNNQARIMFPERDGSSRGKS